MSAPFPPAGVIVLGGVHGALAAARSLGRKGVAVIYLTDDHPLPKFSRYVRESLTWPGPQAPDAAQRLLAIAAERDLEGWLLLPCADGEARLIAENRTLLGERFHIVSLDWGDLRRLADKNCLSELAEQIGIPFPRSYHVDEAAGIAGLDLTFPVLLKPAQREARNSFSQDKVWRAETREELAALYKDAVAFSASSGVVVQDFIPGGGGSQYSYAALWSAGEPVAAMTVRRTRQFPSDFGISCFIETIDEPKICEVAERLLRAVRYQGLVEIDFKFDARDGAFKPLDVNTRVWAWISLGEAAGPDFVAMFYDLAHDRAPTVPAEVRDCRWMHFSRDFLAVIRRGTGRGRLSGYLAGYRRPVAWATFARDDVWPAVAEIPVTALRILRRRLSGG